MEQNVESFALSIMLTCADDPKQSETSCLKINLIRFQPSDWIDSCK